MSSAVKWRWRVARGSFHPELSELCHSRHDKLLEKVVKASPRLKTIFRNRSSDCSSNMEGAKNIGGKTAGRVPTR